MFATKAITLGATSNGIANVKQTFGGAAERACWWRLQLTF